MLVLRLHTDPPERFKPPCTKEEIPKQHQHFWFHWQSPYFMYSKHLEPSDPRRVLVRGLFLSFFFFFSLNKHLLLCLTSMKNIQKQKSMIIPKAHTWEVGKERQKRKERTQGGKAQTKPNRNDISIAGSFSFLHVLKLTNLNSWFQKYRVT